MLFSAAEESGRTVDLDRICLEAVVAGAAKIHPAAYVTLNVSPRTVESPEFSSVAFLRLLAHHQIAPNRVIIELTEREEVENVARLRSNLATCQAAGVRVAADDVGSGNAGLRLLSQIHFDLVKVDLTLIQGGVSRNASADVVTTLAELASRWGATVVAEGIETPEELRFVRKLGLAAGQGYLLGRPSENPTVERVDLQALLSDGDWLDRVVAARRVPRPAAPMTTRAS
jgi:EAL domain-containing protein (putative c-di-GMP-specific phosphodiesterase class I)